MIKVLLYLFFCISLLPAHQSGLSYIELTQKNLTEIEVVYKKPIEDLKLDDITIEFPSACYKYSSTPFRISNGFIISDYRLECREQDLLGHRVWVEGLMRSDKGVVVIYKNKEFIQQALLKSSNPFFLLNRHYLKSELVFEYLELGVEHILSGYDHLMFVFLLLLLAKSTRVLLYAITCIYSFSFTYLSGIYFRVYRAL